MFIILSWQETCVQYWPSVGDSKVLAEFLVEIQNEVEYPGFFERTLSVTQKVLSLIRFMTYSCAKFDEIIFVL